LVSGSRRKRTVTGFEKRGRKQQIEMLQGENGFGKVSKTWGSQAIRRAAGSKKGAERKGEERRFVNPQAKILEEVHSQSAERMEVENRSR